jgi:CheY-like chemotaxis protein
VKKRVLLVDDDPGVRQAMGKVLADAGYDVTTANDGEEAMVRCACEPIDLVLLDLALPARRGWEVYDTLMTRRASIPVVVLTAMPDQYRAAHAAGVGALMEKPIEVTALLKTIEELLLQPQGARLRPINGHTAAKEFRPRPSASAARKSDLAAITPRQKLRPEGALRSGEK